MNPKPDPCDILNAFPKGLIVTDMDGVIRFATARARELAGCGGQPLVGTALHTWIRHAGPLLDTCLEQGRAVENQRVRTRQNSELAASIFTFRQQEKIDGALLILEPYPAAETALKASPAYRWLEKQLNTILDSSYDGIWILDKDGTVLRVNNAGTGLIGI